MSDSFDVTETIHTLRERLAECEECLIFAGKRADSAEQRFSDARTVVEAVVATLDDWATTAENADVGRDAEAARSFRAVADTLRARVLATPEAP